MAGDDVEQQRGVGDRRRERPDLVERRRERDEAVARHAPVGGLHADDAAQRRRLADRAAGVGAERERCEAGGHRGGAAPARAAGDATRVVRVAGGAERRVLGRAAHGELVEVGLADRDRAGRRAARSTTVASYGGRHPSRIRDEQVVGMPRVQRLSLSATGTPASGPGSSPSATADRPRRAAARASSASTRLNACSSASACVDRGEVLVDDVDGRPLARTHLSPRCRRRRSRLFSEDRRHAELAVLDRRRGAQHLVAIDARLHHVVAQHVHERVRMRRRRYAVGVERFDVGRVLEDRGELPGEQVELVVGQLQARQPATWATSSRVMRSAMAAHRTVVADAAPTAGSVRIDGGGLLPPVVGGGRPVGIGIDAVDRDTGRGTCRTPSSSSGMMITSMPWLKIAPNCGGQCRRHASQLMHSDISMRIGAELPLRVALPIGQPVVSARRCLHRVRVHRVRVHRARPARFRHRRQRSAAPPPT